MNNKVYLLLENGDVFEGKSFGAQGRATGEAVFTTGMTGYLETLTDPSYCGQMVVQTFPLIGNYGDIPQDYESDKVWPSAYIVRDFADVPSNFRCQGTLDAMLKAHGVVGMYDLDTRRLTKTLRESGTMNAVILPTLTNISDEIELLHQMKNERPIMRVTCREPIYWNENEGGKRVVVWDFGAKKSMIDKLHTRGLNTVRVPADYSCEQVLALKPDGVLLSNGPGDPTDNPEIIAEIGKLFETGVPIMGICLGHQLLALSQGAKSTRLLYGHRGANQPAMDLKTGRAYMTSQNHGYAIVTSTLPHHAKLLFVNLNDDSCEGVDYPWHNAFSVQFHPEASSGPLDTGYLFDRFVDMMGGARNA